MNLKRITALFLLLMLLLCGCAEQAETPAQIVEKMNTALSETSCTQQEMTLSMVMTMDAGADGSLEMELSTANTQTVCPEPLSARNVITAVTTAGGTTSTTEVVEYILPQDGGLMSYTCADGIWVRAASEMTEDALRGLGLTTDLTGAALDETVTEWNGTAAHCLTTQISGESMKSVLAGSIGSLGVEGEVDYAALSCDVRVYLDAATYLPLAEEVTVTGMDAMLNAAYASMGVSMTIDSCTAATVFSYEPQAEITLPDGAAEAAAAWERLLSGEPDNGDGSYTIREGTVLIDVVTPDGFTMEEKDYDHVSFTRDDHRTITYTMWYLTGDTDAYFTSMADSDESRYSQNGGKTERQQFTCATETLSFTCDILGVTWGSDREDAYLFGWTTLGSDESGTYCLLVEVTDGYSDIFGNSKSADITAEEFMACLNGASPSPLTP